MEYEDRGEWQARPSKRKFQTIRPTSIIFHHHTVGQQGGGAAGVRAIQKTHQNDRGWNDIAYNWLYDDMGRIFEGRGWMKAGGATKGWNTMSHSFAYMGNTMGHKPTEEAFQACTRLINEAERLMGDQQHRPHQSVSATLCPGTHLLNWLKAGRPIKEIAMARAWQDEPAFDAAIITAYETTGPNKRTPSMDERSYWLLRFLNGDDPEWMINACKTGLKAEPAG